MLELFTMNINDVAGIKVVLRESGAAEIFTTNGMVFLQGPDKAIMKFVPQAVVDSCIPNRVTLLESIGKATKEK